MPDAYKTLYNTLYKTYITFYVWIYKTLNVALYKTLYMILYRALYQNPVSDSLLDFIYKTPIWDSICIYKICIGFYIIIGDPT